MTDELYTLYLDTFTMKLSGVDCSTLADLRTKHPTMQQRAVVALALAGACRQNPGLVTREDLARDVERLLEVK